MKKYYKVIAVGKSDILFSDGELYLEYSAAFKEALTAVKQTHILFAVVYSKFDNKSTQVCINKKTLALNGIKENEE